MAAVTDLYSDGLLSNVGINSWRIVEDQSKSTTRKFVDSAEEWEILEGLLDASKPSIKRQEDEKYLKGLHYLLLTCFRYPPLKWGSRFGTKLERNLLYSSKDLETAMCESAFYMFSFLRASLSEKLGGKSLSRTAFSINIESTRYLDMCTQPFSDYRNIISSKVCYQESQEIGKQLRDQNVECFSFYSARSLRNGINIAVYTPRALPKNKNIEKSFTHLNCYTTKNEIEFTFSLKEKNQTVQFNYNHFLVDGYLPIPPNN